MDCKTRLFASPPGWPSVIDMKCGGGLTLERKGGAWALRLVSVRVEKSPDLRAGALPDGKLFKEAKVLLEVDGRQCLLRLAPFSPPVSFQGLRLHVETVKALSAVDSSAKGGFPFDARISASPDSEPWGPLSFRFPLPGHLWRANPCYGAWGSLNAGDSSRYADGCNLGVSEDARSVVAVLSGFVKSIAARPDGLSTIVLEHLHGVRSVYGGIEPGSVPWGLSSGKPVDSGAPLGEASLAARPPHLHFGLELDASRIDPFPFLLESYFRMSQDGAAPFAGGQLFCLPGEKVRFDASQSSALRPERSAASLSWLLSDGSVKEGAAVELSYKEPGFHSEELRMLLDDGQEFRDFAIARVFAPGGKAQPGFAGWLAHSPARPSSGVALKFNLHLPDGFKPLSLSFGDGSSESLPSSESSHSYARPGLYTAEAKGVCPDGSPFALKRAVRVV